MISNTVRRYTWCVRNAIGMHAAIIAHHKTAISFIVSSFKTAPCIFDRLPNDHEIQCRS